MDVTLPELSRQYGPLHVNQTGHLPGIRLRYEPAAIARYWEYVAGFCARTGEDEARARDIIVEYATGTAARWRDMTDNDVAQIGAAALMWIIGAATAADVALLDAACAPSERMEAEARRMDTAWEINRQLDAQTPERRKLLVAIGGRVGYGPGLWGRSTDDLALILRRLEAEEYLQTEGHGYGG